MHRRPHDQAVTVLHSGNRHIDGVLAENTFAKLILAAHTAAHTAADRLEADVELFGLNVFHVERLFHFQ